MDALKVSGNICKAEKKHERFCLFVYLFLLFILKSLNPLPLSPSQMLEFSGENSHCIPFSLVRLKGGGKGGGGGLHASHRSLRCLRMNDLPVKALKRCILVEVPHGFFSLHK